MNDKKALQQTSIRQKTTLPGVFLVVVFLIALFGILPTTQAITATRGEIDVLKADLERQEILLPVWVALQQSKKRSFPDGISVRTVTPLDSENLDDLREVFEKLAQASQVELISVTTDVNTLEGNTKLVRLDCQLRGDFNNFRTTLGKLNELPMLQTVESLSIEVAEAGYELNLSVWLAIK
ncbi:MAG: hypothetical protein ACON5H_00035 [Akkermansiaceae bacterium]